MTPEDIALVRDVAKRTWAAVERAKAETALQEREADLARLQRIGCVGGVNIVLAPGTPCASGKNGFDHAICAFVSQKASFMQHPNDANMNQVKVKKPSW